MNSAKTEKEMHIMHEGHVGIMQSNGGNFKAKWTLQTWHVNGGDFCPRMLAPLTNALMTVSRFVSVDRQDIDRYVEQISSRCSTIDVCVKTVRDKPQEEALYKINGIIDRLITQIQQDPTASKEKCLMFMNSCTSFSEVGMEDSTFEQALLGCTIDDQKRVRRRLQGLMTYIEKLSMSY